MSKRSDLVPTYLPGDTRRHPNLINFGSIYEMDISDTVRWGNHHRSKLSSGERRLALAVLEDAIAAFKENIFGDMSQAKQLCDEARQWLWSDDEKWPYSFINICGVFNIEPSAIRRELKKWQQQQLEARKNIGR